MDLFLLNDDGVDMDEEADERGLLLADAKGLVRNSKLPIVEAKDSPVVVEGSEEDAAVVDA